MPTRRGSASFGAPTTAQALVNVTNSANVAMPAYDTSTDFTVPGDSSLDSLTFTLQSGTLQTGLMLNAETGVISGTPTEAAARALTIRGTNRWGTADTNSFTLTISANTLSLFADGELTANASTEGSERDLSQWDASGTPTLTAQTVEEGNTPQLIETDQTFERAEQNGHNITSGNTHRASVVFEEPGSDNAAQFRVTFKDDDDGGAEDYVDVSWTAGSPLGASFSGASQTFTTGPSNTSVTALSSDRFRAEFEMTFNQSSTDVRFGIGPNVNDDTGVIVHSCALSTALSGGSGGGAEPSSWVAIADAAGTDPYGNTFGTPSDANGIESSFAAAIADPVASLSRLETVLINNGPGTAVVFKGNDEGSPIAYTDNSAIQALLINSPLSGTSANPIRFISSTYRGAKILGPNTNNGGVGPDGIRISDSSFIRLYNLQVECRAVNQDNAALFMVFSDPPEDGDLPRADILLSGCKFIASGNATDGIKGTKVVGITMEGCSVDFQSGDESILDFVTCQEVTVDFCEFEGSADQHAFQPKTGSNDYTVTNSIFRNTSTSNNDTAFAFGELGQSARNREYPFGGTDEFRYASVWDISVDNCEFYWSNSSHGVWFRGAERCSITNCWFEGPGNAIEMTSASNAAWVNMPVPSSAGGTDNIPAEFQAYTEYFDGTPPPPGLSTGVDGFQYETRDITIGTNYRKFGQSLTIIQQNSGTNTVTAMTEAANGETADDHLTGTRGPDGFDALAIYGVFGMPDGT